MTPLLVTMKAASELLSILLDSDNGANAAYQITKKIVELETGWAINEKTTF